MGFEHAWTERAKLFEFSTFRSIWKRTLSSAPFAPWPRNPGSPSFDSSSKPVQAGYLRADRGAPQHSAVVAVRPPEIQEMANQQMADFIRYFLGGKREVLSCLDRFTPVKRTEIKEMPTR